MSSERDHRRAASQSTVVSRAKPPQRRMRALPSTVPPSHPPKIVIGLSSEYSQGARRRVSTPFLMAAQSLELSKAWTGHHLLRARRATYTFSLSCTSLLAIPRHHTIQPTIFHLLFTSAKIVPFIISIISYFTTSG